MTPGIYIDESNAFPTSVVAVATAIPVFIGYTMRADYEGKSCLNQAVRIGSFHEFLSYYGMQSGTPPTTASEQQQYVPIYHAVPSQGQGDVTLGGSPFDLLPDPSTIYYLYNSLKLFYQNGGDTAYIVSVGLIPSMPKLNKPMIAGSPLVNPNVAYAELFRGLQVSSLVAEITIIVIPDAVLLKEADHATLMQNVLMQCTEGSAPGSRVALLDVHGGEAPDPLQLNQPNGEINVFRTGVGTTNLSYGIAYFPFLKTTIVQDRDINYVNLGGGKELATVLPGADNGPLKTILDQIQNPPATNAPQPSQLESALLAASPEYKRLHDVVLEKINTLPPSGAMAGVYTKVDNNRGVWHAPANVSLTAVTDTTLKITGSTQELLSMDVTTGKYINAIRPFPGLGIMAWGASTLDGNSPDWRKINVRRTMIMLEQSLKDSMRAYIFDPNTEQTWSRVSSMVTSFLIKQWSLGALAGPTQKAAFSVAIGLGQTMTTDDILNGNMILSVEVAVSRPADFLNITIKQKLQS